MAIRVFALSARTVLDAARGAASQDRNNRRLKTWADSVVSSARANVSVVGREHMAPHAIYVIMSNHQSHYDVPVIYHALGGNIRMVAKKELFAIPLFGKAMREAGFIEVDRKDRARAIAALRGATRLLENGTHLWIAPEGTRSEDGRLGPFKKGGFAVALDAELPILPVTISGTRHILKPHEMRTHVGADVRVTIHAPLSTHGIPRGDKAAREELMERVRIIIGSALPTEQVS